MTAISKRVTCDVEPMQFDEALLRQASLRSTGATIHAVRGLASLYTIAHHGGMRPEFEAAERRLRRFIVTGIIPKN